MCVPFAFSFLFEDANNLQNLLSLITEEKRLRSTVENEIRSLKNDIADMKAKHKAGKLTLFPQMCYRNDHNLVGTWRSYNVASTSMQRHDVASTLVRRCYNVAVPLGSIRTH